MWASRSRVHTSESNKINDCGYRTSIIKYSCNLKNDEAGLFIWMDLKSQPSVLDCQVQMTLLSESSDMQPTIIDASLKYAH